MNVQGFGGLAEVPVVGEIGRQRLQQVGSLSVIVFGQFADNLVAKRDQFRVVFQLEKEAVDVQFAEIEWIGVGKSPRRWFPVGFPPKVSVPPKLQPQE